jgi:hypothetical protein
MPQVDPTNICRQCVFLVNNACKLHRNIFINRVTGQGSDHELRFVRMALCRGNWFLPKPGHMLGCPP